MITESGRVVAVEDDCLWVETIQRSACQSCAAEKACGQKLISRWGASAGYLRVLLEGRDSRDYHIDDQVTIGVPEGVVAGGSLLVYMLPLVVMVVLAVVSSLFGASEGWVVISALVGLALGGGVVRWHSAITRNNPRYQPVLMDNPIVNQCP